MNKLVIIFLTFVVNISLQSFSCMNSQTTMCNYEGNRAPMMSTEELKYQSSCAPMDYSDYAVLSSNQESAKMTFIGPTNDPQPTTSKANCMNCRINCETRASGTYSCKFKYFDYGCSSEVFCLNSSSSLQTVARAADNICNMWNQCTPKEKKDLPSSSRAANDEEGAFFGLFFKSSNKDMLDNQHTGAIAYDAAYAMNISMRIANVKYAYDAMLYNKMLQASGNTNDFSGFFLATLLWRQKKSVCRIIRHLKKQKQESEFFTFDCACFEKDNQQFAQKFKSPALPEAFGKAKELIILARRIYDIALPQTPFGNFLGDRRTAAFKDRMVTVEFESRKFEGQLQDLHKMLKN